MARRLLLTRQSEPPDGGMPGRRDIAVAAALAALVALGTMAAARLQAPPRPLDGGAYLLVFVAAVAIAWRRVAPLAMLAGVIAAVGLYLIVGYPFGPIQLCMVVAMFEVARRRALPLSLLACGLAVATVVAAALPRLAQGADQPALLVAAWSGWVVVPWALGALVNVRADATERLRRDLIATVSLEGRMTMAREVHDVAGHGFSAIAMQAGVALVVLDERPDQARLALEAIRATSTQALDELRAVLGLVYPPGLRAPADVGLRLDVATGLDERGLHDLGALVDRVRAAGLPVELDLVSGDGTLPRELTTVAYRIVQEALTNILRHAGPTHSAVRVRREASAVVVEVTDRGRGALRAPYGAGRGLSGMRARVEAVGGTLVAGPRDGGGFRVVARLPLTEAA